MTVSFLDCSIAAFRELTSLSTCRRQLVRVQGQPGAVVDRRQPTKEWLCSSAVSQTCTRGWINPHCVALQKNTLVRHCQN